LAEGIEMTLLFVCVLCGRILVSFFWVFCVIAVPSHLLVTSFALMSSFAALLPRCVHAAKFFSFLLAASAIETRRFN
jgi:hypothetical protein